ncbi:MAG: alpha/beta hydrolase [Pseudomonadales bacterium]|jgi:acetyl esterase|nr:alpha/beta hydrolase [Pseudomonadales bacterium]MDP6469842.1 alpha/beta hydrolase [Pseudomonadales bacterium]MDP6827556.1 alpha/beta hydrolase [Pseudomonadales bacterium]MDP6971312.1 alpha/beta hydrolase [Pseudomonadales bacterium]|tara:strand:+ start:154 stop:1071 length:918 start_codon:yes stop_codon:yes gene_type:complete
MPLDADAQGVLDLLASQNVPDFTELSPAEARALTLAPPPEVPTAVDEVEDRIIPGSEADIPVRIYRARGATGTLAYFHGGGWVIGDLESHDESCRRLCAGTGANVVAVDYRLAPETRYPGAINDCFDATAWIASSDEFSGPLAVGGDSAGGNLAAATALMARDRGAAELVFQLLVYPVTNADFTTVSYRDNAEDYFLTRGAMQWFWDHYVPDAGTRADPYCAPLRAPDLAALPPALVITAEYDPLRDEGEAYAAALEAAGVPVTLTRYPGQIHGFFGMYTAIAAATRATEQAIEALRSHLTPHRG